MDQIEVVLFIVLFTNIHIILQIVFELHKSADITFIMSMLKGPYWLIIVHIISMLVYLYTRARKCNIYYTLVTFVSYM